MSTGAEHGPRRIPPAGALGLLLALTLVSGCTVGPNYRAQLGETPPAWLGATSALGPPAGAAAELVMARWWTVFQDPQLSALIERAIPSNLELKLATARVRQARASRGITAAAAGPSANATGGLTRSRPAGSVASGKRPSPATQYQTGFDAAWEFDLAGGVRRGIEAADADLLATEAAQQGALITLVAEVARTYVELRLVQQRLEIARQNLTSQQHTAELTQKRLAGGLVNGLDVANAQAQVAATAAQIPVLEASAQQTVYGLSLLLGLAPGALLPELSPAGALPVAPLAVPLGVPSELLRRRPDIRQAEARIQAATARIGVATADLYPRFTLSGAVGYQAAHAGNLINPLSQFWSLGPSVTWNVFASGRIRSNIELQKALEEESAIAYRQTVLTALQEVENALVAATKEREHGQTLTAATEAYRRAARLAATLYAEGQTDFLNVLLAQRALQAAEDASAQSRAALSTHLIALYKALGGGWDTAAAAPGDSAQAAP